MYYVFYLLFFRGLNMRLVPLLFSDGRVFTGSFIWFCFGGLPTGRFLAVLLSNKTSVTFSLTRTIGLDIPTKIWAVFCLLVLFIFSIGFVETVKTLYLVPVVMWKIFKFSANWWTLCLSATVKILGNEKEVTVPDINFSNVSHISL